MGLKAGIIGLPNVGKSTLFSGLTKMEAERANYAFTTINPNVSIVELNDPRLDHLAKLSQSEKVIKFLAIERHFFDLSFPTHYNTQVTIKINAKNSFWLNTNIIEFLK